MELEFRPPNPGHPLLDATQDRSPPIHGHVTTTPRDLTISMVPRFRLMVLIPFSSPLMELESRPPNPGHPLLDATQDRSPPIHGHVTTTPRVHITLMEPSFNWSTDHQSSATGTISMRPTPETSQRRVVSLASPQPNLFRAVQPSIFSLRTSQRKSPLSQRSQRNDNDEEDKRFL